MSNELIEKKKENIRNILAEYNEILIHYEVEKELLRKCCYSSRWDLIQAFRREGYFLKWLERYNAKGKKIFIPIKR